MPEPTSPYGTAVCQLTVTVALGRTLPAQRVVLAALLRKHGPGQRWQPSSWPIFSASKRGWRKPG
ncbi:hypothetical protein O0544_20605 [Edwardsiella anguillarum]|nr:hypothetical protein [Edwardsiella anguillarum]